MRYFVKTPWWLKQLYPKRVWRVATSEKEVYLTFDDGPHPVATPFVLDELSKHNMKATFFCIGKNVEAYPEIYQRILEEGHRTGNHTHHHLNGWKTGNHEYVSDVAKATKSIHSNLFRPPYGRLRSSQAKGIRAAMQNESSKIIMWDVLSGDFDQSISKEKCFEQVSRVIQPGSIVVFHDSEKAFENLAYALPQYLQLLAQKGYSSAVL